MVPGRVATNVEAGICELRSTPYRRWGPNHSLRHGPGGLATLLLTPPGRDKATQALSFRSILLCCEPIGMAPASAKLRVAEHAGRDQL